MLIKLLYFKMSDSINNLTIKYNFWISNLQNDYQTRTVLILFKDGVRYRWRPFMSMVLGIHFRLYSFTATKTFVMVSLISL